MDSSFVQIIKHTDIHPRNVSESLDELLGKLTAEEESTFKKECIGNVMLAMFRIVRVIKGADPKVLTVEDHLIASKELYVANQCLGEAISCIGDPYKVSCNALDAVYHAALADGYARSLGPEECKEKASLALFEERQFQYKVVNELKSGGAG